MRRWIVSLVAMGLAACAAPVPPSPTVVQAAPSPGLVFARTTCAACHAVEAGQIRSPNPAAPPFETVAAAPDMTRIAFGAWMRSSHPSMPNLILTQREIDDLWAYLESLQGRDRT